MKNFNQVILGGRLTRDPEQTVVGSGVADKKDQKVTKFTIACDTGYEKHPVDFINCCAWNGLGDIITKHCKKGTEVIIGGHIRQDRWTDKETQTQRSRIIVTAEEFRVISTSDNSNAEPQQ